MKLQKGIVSSVNLTNVQDGNVIRITYIPSMDPKSFASVTLHGRTGRRPACTIQNADHIPSGLASLDVGDELYLYNEKRPSGSPQRLGKIAIIEVLR